jgi:hypothetical protein
MAAPSAIGRWCVADRPTGRRRYRVWIPAMEEHCVRSTGEIGPVAASIPAPLKQPR